MTLHRLLYRSDAEMPGTAETIENVVDDIVALSAERNAAAGITGALVFTSRTFIQALEGPLEAVEATFERISCDLRHRRVRLLEASIATERAFANWSMARARPQIDLARLPFTPGAESESPLHRLSAAEAIRTMRVALLANLLKDARPVLLGRAIGGDR